MGNWKEIVDEQLFLLNKSGLIKASKKVFACVVGSTEIPEAIKNVEILDRSQNLCLYEMFTLRHLKSFCDKNPNCQIWYIHTKGASRSDVYGKYWREYLDYFIIERWKACVRGLEGYDVCGVEWQENHFSGNFWWATSNYIKTLESDVACHNDRLKAEIAFIGTKNPHVNCLNHAGKNFYEEILPHEQYRATFLCL